MGQFSLQKRVEELEKQIDFILSITKVTIMAGSPLDPMNVRQVVVSAKELYNQIRHQGAQLVDAQGSPLNSDAAEGASSGVEATQPADPDPSSDSAAGASADCASDPGESPVEGYGAGV